MIPGRRARRRTRHRQASASCGLFWARTQTHALHIEDGKGCDERSAEPSTLRWGVHLSRIAVEGCNSDGYTYNLNNNVTN